MANIAGLYERVEDAVAGHREAAAILNNVRNELEAAVRAEAKRRLGELKEGKWIEETDEGYLIVGIRYTEGRSMQITYERIAK